MTEQERKDKAADVADVLAALKRRPSKLRGGHSPIYLWLWQHHDQLLGELVPHRTDWSALAGELTSRGMVDGNGKPLTAERVRKAWWQVGRDKEAHAAGTVRRRRKPVQAGATPGKAGTRKAAATPAPDAPVVNNGMLPPGIEPAEAEPPTYKFEFAKPKDWTKTTDTGDQ